MFFVTSLIVSCGGKKDQLMADYKTIQSHADNSEWDQVFEGIDSKSQEFLTKLADPANADFDKLRKLGLQYGVPYTALSYHFDWGKVTGEKDVGNIFRFCSMRGTPVFAIFGEQVLLPEQTSVGTETYITLARKVNTNTLVSKKIAFVEEDGVNKLDFLRLLDRSEKDFRSAYKKYYNGLQKVDSETAEDLEIDPLYIFMKDDDRASYFPKGYQYDIRQSSKKDIR